MRISNVLWPAAVVLAFFAGIVIDRTLTSATTNESEGRLQRDVRVDAGTEIPTSLPPAEATTVETVPSETGDHHDEEGNDHVGESSEPPQLGHTYRFPFEDNRRVEVPTGDLVDNVRAVYEEISRAILERWGTKYADTLFSQGMRFSDEGRVVENKMLNAVVEQGGFVAAFTGISLTAGHDCLYEQSYPILLNTTLSRLFAAAGVRYQAVNVAMGNTPAVPYSYCVDAHAGIDADIISWEMAMMVAENQCGPAAEAVELFIRQAAVLPRRPAVLIMVASPDQDNCAEGQLGKVVNHNRNFVGNCEKEPKEKGLMSAYQHFGLHDIYMNELISRFTCEDKLFSKNDLFHFGKTYPKPTVWHPGTHGHELMADVLFMHYAHVFLNALQRLENAAPGVTAQQLRDETEADKLSLLASIGIENPEEVSGNGQGYMGAGRGDILPNPRWCAGWRFCEGAGNYRCANTFSPLAGREGSRLLDMVSERTPFVNSGRKHLVAEPTEGHWAVTLNEVKKSVLDYVAEPVPTRFAGMHKPIDMKWVLVGNGNSGPIEFGFETKGLANNPEEASSSGENAGSSAAEAIEDSRVVVCKASIIDCIRLDDRQGVRFRLDGIETSVLRPIAHRYLNPQLCVLLAAQVGVGKHTLRVEPLRVKGSPVSISHVIYPA